MGFLDRLRRASPLTPAAAAAGAQQGALLLVDVREPAEYQTGHAPEAVNVPLSQVGSVLGDLSGQHAEIAFVCRSGARSALAVRTAARSGIAARNVRGGMLAWQRARLPTAAGHGSRVPTVG